MRILVIEDNPLLAQTLRQMLKQFYAIDICNSGKKGLLEASHTNYDVIILDLGLPDMCGEEICKALRKEGVYTPIIVISGRGEIDSKVSLLKMGADDYVTKPFNLSELHARIDVAMRHTSNNNPAGTMSIEGLELDTMARTVVRFGQPVVLRRKEFDLLEYLLRNKGQTLTRAMILEHIWDMNENLWANVVDVHIKHIRDKIDRPFGSKLIQTVHGIGYKIAAKEI